jgi:hypothetical protein
MTTENMWIDEARQTAKQCWYNLDMEREARDTASWKTRWEVVNDSDFYEFFTTFPEKGIFSISAEVLR